MAGFHFQVPRVRHHTIHTVLCYPSPRSPHNTSPLQSYKSLTAPVMELLCFCRRLELHNFASSLLSIRAQNIEELSLVRYCFESYRLMTKQNIGRIAAMTSLRSLELQRWQEWDDVKPLTAPTLLRQLTSDQGLRLIGDLLEPGCLQSLEIALLPQLPVLAT